MKRAAHIYRDSISTETDKNKVKIYAHNINLRMSSMLKEIIRKNSSIMFFSLLNRILEFVQGTFVISA